MRRRQRGFSLIEVMIAMTILAAALTWIVVGMARNISAENHAKLMTTATFLARSKMIDIEDDLHDKGFGEFEKDQTGTFEDKGFQRFSYKIVVDKVELPSTSQVQTALGKAQDAKSALTGQDPSQQQPPPQQQQNQDPMTSSVAAMSSQFGMVKDVLEGGIRRVTTTISWWEGQHPFDVTVSAYYTDPSRVDQAINTSALAAAANAAGGTTATGTSTSSTATSTSTSSTSTSK
jgi:general secretion pathway protein I